MKILVIIATLTTALVACDVDKKEPTGVIPQAQLDALEKANGVEDALKQQEQETRRKMDEAKY